MKKFLAIYLGSDSSSAATKWESLDEKTRHEKESAGMSAWMKWATENAKPIVDNGTPLGTTKRIDAQGVSSTTNQIVAYTIVEAESHEAAAELFVNHPHFMVFPGDSVEIMECLPLPGM